MYLDFNFDLGIVCSWTNLLKDLDLWYLVFEDRVSREDSPPGHYSLVFVGHWLERLGIDYSTSLLAHLSGLHEAQGGSYRYFTARSKWRHIIKTEASLQSTKLPPPYLHPVTRSKTWPFQSRSL